METHAHSTLCFTPMQHSPLSARDFVFFPVTYKIKCEIKKKDQNPDDCHWKMCFRLRFTTLTHPPFYLTQKLHFLRTLCVMCIVRNTEEKEKNGVKKKTMKSAVNKFTCSDREKMNRAKIVYRLFVFRNRGNAVNLQWNCAVLLCACVCVHVLKRTFGKIHLPLNDNTQNARITNQFVTNVQDFTLFSVFRCPLFGCVLACFNANLLAALHKISKIERKQNTEEKIACKISMNWNEKTKDEMNAKRTRKTEIEWIMWWK